MKVRDLMTTDVWTVSQDANLSDAAEIMWNHDCGSVPVTDGSRHVVGVITDRDICMAAYTRGQAPAAIGVGSAMSRELVSCSPDDSLRTVEELMRDRQIRRMPVLEKGSLIGMITLGDLIHQVQDGGVRGALTMPGMLKTLEGIYERRGAAAAAE